MNWLNMREPSHSQSSDNPPAYRKVSHCKSSENNKIASIKCFAPPYKRAKPSTRDGLGGGLINSSRQKIHIEIWRSDKLEVIALC